MNISVQNNNLISRELTAVEMENIMGGGIDPLLCLCYGIRNDFMHAVDTVQIPLANNLISLFDSAGCNQYFEETAPWD